MFKKRYVYNKDELKFEEYKLTPRKIGHIILYILLYSIIGAAAVYLVVSLFIDAPDQRRLKRENRFISQTYNKMSANADLLDNSVQSLQYRDKQIYGEIFKSEPPDFAKADTVINYARLDTVREVPLVWDTYLKGRLLQAVASDCRKSVDEIEDRLESLGDSAEYIPSIVPISRFTLASTGASVGKKVNPFLKTIDDHEGIDLIAPIGTEVLASAKGTVVKIDRLKKGLGNSVRIDHGNGLTTVYGHLNDILVRQGQRVSSGEVIGRVGNSGTSFAPHLHYGVSLNGKPQDPVNYFFGDLDGNNYREMLIIATNTGQSLD